MRANDAQVLKLWVASWTWRDANDLTEIIFADSKQMCSNMLEERLGVAAMVLRELWIVQKGNARAYLKSAEPVRVNAFDLALRPYLRTVMPDFQEHGFAVWRQPTYEGLIALADSFEQ